MARILFVKTSSLGDVVHNCPAVSDAARAMPGVEIDWVVEESFAGIAAMHAAVGRVIPVAVRRWRRAAWQPSVWREIAVFRRTLAGQRYDAVIDTQSLLKSALIACCAQGPRHGLDRTSAREAIAARFYDKRYAVPRELHAVERNRRLAAAALGYPLGALDYGLRAPGVAAEAKPLAVLLTMTSREDKLWPEERWIEVGRALAQSARLSAVLPWGSEVERRRVERIAQALPEARVPRRLPLDELASLFSSSRAVIGVDTGLTHLAAALGTPTIGVYCGSDPALTGIYGARRAANVGALGRVPQAREVLDALARMAA
jgi:heptosyltransferase I